MSVYIKGMEMPEMPESIEQREAIPFVDVRIFADGTAFISKGKRPCFTPYIAVPVPEHGDLIDRQAFRYEMDKHYPFDNATQRRHGIEDVLKSAVLRMLFDAPTIIPADKEGEE